MTYQVIDGKSNTITFASINNAGVNVVQSVPSTSNGAAVQDANPLSVSVQARQTVWADCSGTLSGTSSQTIIIANPNRKGLWIQNQDLTNNLYIRLDGGVAGPGYGILIPSGGLYEMPIHMISTAAITAKGINNHVFSASESS
jgi:hypothetical protein